MREITCEDGMRWRVEATADAAIPDDATDAGAPRVVLLSCVTCEGAPQHVTIRAPLDEWPGLADADLCRLIVQAGLTDA
jgi:hypothetical protein